MGASGQSRADERVAARVDVVGVRLHGPGDQHDRAGRPPGERVDLERDVLGSEPGCEPLLVGGVAGDGPQAVEHLGHVLFVALPGDVGGGELHERPGPLVGQHPGRVGADVADQHVRPVAVEGGPDLRQDVHPLVEEAGHPGDRVVGPGLPAVLVGEHGGDRHDGGAGGGDGRCEPGRRGDLDAVAARDELGEHGQVRVHVPVGGHADHDDVERGHRLLLRSTDTCVCRYGTDVFGGTNANGQRGGEIRYRSCAVVNARRVSSRAR